MKKVKFICHHFVMEAGIYDCDSTGDQSGEYVLAEVAEELLAALKALLTEAPKQAVDGSVDAISFAAAIKLAKSTIAKSDN